MRGGILDESTAERSWDYHASNGHYADEKAFGSFRHAINGMFWNEGVDPEKMFPSGEGSEEECDEGCFFSEEGKEDDGYCDGDLPGKFIGLQSGCR